MMTTGAVSAAALPTTLTGNQSYFVDCSARAGGDGSMASPWNSTMSVGLHGAFSPGDQILFKRATSCSGRVAPSGSGLAADPIVLGAYGYGVKPTIRGAGTPDDTGTVTLRNVHDWTVQDLHLTNRTDTRTTTYRAGLLILNENGGRLPNVTAQRLTVDSVVSNPASGLRGPRAFGGIAVQTSGAGGDGFDNLNIVHNSLDKVGRSGIAVFNNEYPNGFDTDVRIGYDIVRSARGDSIILSGVRGGRIDHSLSANGDDFWPCPQCKSKGPETANAGIWTAKADHVRIDHNEVYGEHRLGGDGEGLDVDKFAEHVIVEANYVHDNTGGGILICHAVDTDIRFNILQNNTRAEFVFTTSVPSANIHIYNNDIYVARSIAANSVVRRKKGSGAKGTQFFNNLVFSWGHSVYRWQGKVSSKANTFVGYHSSTEPSGPATSHVDPGLRAPGHGGIGMRSVTGYLLRTTKSAQRGAAIPGSATTDYFGKKVDTKHPYRGASSK